ncbi:hypothetical protein CROQUDRAFT_703835, partial [Cronartium quercuum f. sp. fusiforme G11]
LPLPPPSPTTAHQPLPQQDVNLDPHSFKIIHFNAHKSLVVMHEILTHTEFDVIALQEPGINPYTLQPPPHQAWNLFTQYDYKPSDYHTCP